LKPFKFQYVVKVHMTVAPRTSKSCSVFLKEEICFKMIHFCFYV